MNNLWVYGCSFSEPFGLTPFKIEFNEDGTRNLNGIEYWGTYLSKKMKINCKTRSFPGVGWNYINNRIDEDICSWGKNDIIIISPSFFSRFTSEEFLDSTIDLNIVGKIKSVNEIIFLNENRWKNKIKSLQFLGFNVHTWVVDKIQYVRDVENLISPNNKQISWKEWMDDNKMYWIDPTTNKYPLGDWHFNNDGHAAVAEIMYKYFLSKAI